MAVQFVREQTLAYQKSATGHIPATVFRHRAHGLRVVQCQVAQPLFSLAIFVPTLPGDDKGLPHTLEHLVFCGSQRHAHRGFLDALANCNFSHGTNAWTADDCTCYTLTAASEQALLNVLPAYLDHVLRPQLRAEQFVAEVYHHDERGRGHGVVFSEMLATENEEAEVAERHLARLLFGAGAAYGPVYGGLTRDIARLANAEVVDYHRRFYGAGNLTVLLTGPFAGRRLEQALQALPADLLERRGRDSRAPIDCTPPPRHARAWERVPFAADPGADTGSVRFAWRGPASEDVATLVAVEILLEYLAEEASSPLSRRFVERAQPLASSVVGTIKETIPASLFITFEGVPYGAAGSEAGSETGSETGSEAGSETGSEAGSETGSEAGSETGSEAGFETGSETDSEADSEADSELSDGNDNECEDPDLPRLFDDGYFAALLHRELVRIHASRFDGDEQALPRAARQYAQRLAQSMESRPDEMLQQIIGVEVVASHFAPGFAGKSALGTRARVFDVVADLARRPTDYWLGLLKTWLIDARACHVVMVPDATLGARLERERRQAERENAARVVDRDAHRERIARALESNRVDLPAAVRAAIPLPDARGTATLPHRQRVLAAPGALAAAQVVQCDTEFVDVQLHVPLGAVPEALRPYLVLFQALVFSSDVALPAGACYGGRVLAAPLRVPHDDVDRQLAELTTSRGCAVGLGAEPFVSAWVDELLVLALHTAPAQYAAVARWTMQLLAFGAPTRARILAVAQNLLGEIARIKRDGDLMLMAAVARLSAADRAGRPRWIENHASLFDQERVLRQIVADARRGHAQPTLDSLAAIRRLLLRPHAAVLSLCVPDAADAQAYVDAFAAEWHACLPPSAQRAPPPGPARAARPFDMPCEPRLPALAQALRVHVTLKSVQAASLAICIPCALSAHPDPLEDFDAQLARLPARDFYALCMLLELLHRTDGPLYNAVRGPGFAYSAYFAVHTRAQQLGFYCSRAADVSRAVLALQTLLGQVADAWDEHVGALEIAMARSAMVFASVEAQASPQAVLSQSVSSAVDGFASLELKNRWRNAHIDAVTPADLRRVFDQHVRRFFDPDCPAIAVALTPADTQLLPELGAYTRRSLAELSATKDTV